eukprot:TRINITY_DN3088_c0_g1_i1.p1 TRINITY_DN3088_c0_g1~~TRINITY_DN3088_c0_g1_i1.p1  ORF type:complete len:642 (+),score=178.51 TRINITY_DN3088_c0_g1_i1:62-1927(+)
MRGLLFIWLFLSVFCLLASSRCLNSHTTIYLAPDDIDFRVPPPNPSYFPSLSFQGLTLSLNSSNGLLQVWEEGSQKLLVSFGLEQKVCTGGNGNGCKTVFQNDGNFVLYYPDGSATGTSTYKMNARWIAFSTSTPYLSITTDKCEQVWPKSDTKYVVSPSARTTAILGPTKSANVEGLKAIPSSNWKSSFGICSHIDQGWNSAKTANGILYIGAGWFRDGVPSPNNADWNANYAKLYSAGVRLNTLAGGASNKSELAAQVQRFVDYNTRQPGMLAQLEGFNEINNFGFNYNGYNKSITYRGMAIAMNDFYSLVQASSLKVPVLDLTAGTFSDGAQWGLDDYKGHADLGNVHNYAFGGAQPSSFGGASNLFSLSLKGSYPKWNWPTSNFAMTEIGYYTWTDANSVSEAAQGKMLVNTLLEGLLIGFRQTFIYELWDERWSNYEGSQSHYGVFRNDWSPKPAARALHFLSELLQDDKTEGQQTGTLNFQLENFPVGGQYLLFQKSSGLYTLVLWNRAPVWDGAADVTTPTVQVKLSLGSSADIKFFNLYNPNSNDTKPLEPANSSKGTSIQFDFADQAVALSFVFDSSPISPASSSGNAKGNSAALFAPSLLFGTILLLSTVL